MRIGLLIKAKINKAKKIKIGTIKYLFEGEKKLKNKFGIDKIKIVYFD